MSGPRAIIEALASRGSRAAIVDHLATRGASSARELSEAYAITRAGARAQLIRLHAAGVVELEDLGCRAVAGVGRHRYYLEPDALRYAARWLDALAERAERVNRGEVLTLQSRSWSR